MIQGRKGHDSYPGVVEFGLYGDVLALGFKLRSKDLKLCWLEWTVAPDRSQFSPQTRLDAGHSHLSASAASTRSIDPTVSTDMTDSRNLAGSNTRETYRVDWIPC
jgi:hypothetical protein